MGTISFRAASAALFAALQVLAPAALAQSGNLEPVAGFGSNPGNLQMFKYVPRNLDRGRPLVVALHGCTQRAADYDDETGWTMLADKLRFALLLPQQQKANNDRLCFNWFLAEDHQREKGEARSIREMIDRMKADHAVDPKNIYITGLSAGGAMTAVMLAAYPELFVAGASIAGVPYKCASDTIAALTNCGVFGGSMQDLTPKQWGDLVRSATTHRGKFPRISLWHGSDDTTVKPKDMQELMEQWTNVLGIDQTPEITETVNGRVRHQVFEDAGGKALVETWLVAGMKHGTPIDPGPGEDQCGLRPHAEHIIEAGICSSYRIVKFWGLDNQAPTVAIASASASGTTITVSGVAADPDGFVARVTASLAGKHAQMEKDAVGTGDWSVVFDNLPDNARYLPIVTARDDQGAAVTLRAAQPVVVGSPPANLPPELSIAEQTVQGTCISVQGSASDSDGSVERVEIALGDTGFKPALLNGRGYGFTQCNLAEGQYAVKAKATDELGASTQVAGRTLAVERQLESASATWQEHMNAGRLKVQRPPCRSGFGACDEDFAVIFRRHGAAAFPLHRAPRSGAWYVDAEKAKQN
ncbi:MAG TPA: PHB depolymerase family esterase [Paucimonas sp.]|nr:PHB depolymerase family esterase [Paucimonas sp.]